MIFFLRHGETALNRAKVLQGRSDYPLNEAGRAQAEAVRDKLMRAGITFDRVWTSPLQRAVQTAAIVAPDLAPVPDSRLTEMDYGPYEGASLTDLPQEVLTFFGDFVHCPAPAGMEQLDAVVSRVGAFLEDIRDIPGNHLISTHAIAMKGGLEYLTPGSGGAYWNRFIGNCAVFVCGNEGGRLSVPKPLEL